MWKSKFYRSRLVEGLRRCKGQARSRKTQSGFEMQREVQRSSDPDIPRAVFRGLEIHRNVAPAMQSALRSSQSLRLPRTSKFAIAAPATKSAPRGSPSAAPATKSARQDSHRAALPRRFAVAAQLFVSGFVVFDVIFCFDISFFVDSPAESAKRELFLDVIYSASLFFLFLFTYFFCQRLFPNLFDHPIHQSAGHIGAGQTVSFWGRGPSLRNVTPLGP